MAQVRETWELDHPVDDVWELFVDPDRWMRRNRGVSDMHDVRRPRVRDEFEPTDPGCRVTIEMALDAPAGRLGDSSTLWSPSARCVG